MGIISVALILWYHEELTLTKEQDWSQATWHFTLAALCSAGAVGREHFGWAVGAAHLQSHCTDP